MRRCSFNTNDSFDRLLSQDRVTQTASNVREFLVISPLYFPLVTSVVIIMRGSSSIFLSLLEVDLLGLREPGSGGLSPSVVELKVNVVQMAVRALSVGDLIVPGRDVALLVEVFGANLSDMHVNHVRVVSIDLHHLVLVLPINVDVVVGADVLVGQHAGRLSKLVAWGFHVVHFQVLCFLLLVDFEEEVLFCDNLFVSALSHLFS